MVLKDMIRLDLPLVYERLHRQWWRLWESVVPATRREVERERRSVQDIAADILDLHERIRSSPQVLASVVAKVLGGEPRDHIAPEVVSSAVRQMISCVAVSRCQRHTELKRLRERWKSGGSSGGSSFHSSLLRLGAAA